MSKSSKVRVGSIQITHTDGSTIEFSIEDAKELYRQLDDLFGEKQVLVPRTPVIIERDHWPRWGTPPVICQDTPTREVKVWCRENRQDCLV